MEGRVPGYLAHFSSRTKPESQEAFSRRRLAFEDRGSVSGVSVGPVRWVIPRSHRTLARSPPGKSVC